MLNGIRNSTQSQATIQDQIDKLINDWVNLQTLFDDGWSALHLAISTNEDLFIYLSETLHADLSLMNKNGVTLMHKAAKDDNPFIIAYLVEKCGIGFESVDKDGNTPLHYACVF